MVQRFDWLNLTDHGLNQTTAEIKPDQKIYILNKCMDLSLEN